MSFRGQVSCDDVSCSWEHHSDTNMENITTHNIEIKTFTQIYAVFNTLQHISQEGLVDIKDNVRRPTPTPFENGGFLYVPFLSCAHCRKCICSGQWWQLEQTRGLLSILFASLWHCIDISKKYLFIPADFMSLFYVTMSVALIKWLGAYKYFHAVAPISHWFMAIWASSCLVLQPRVLFTTHNRCGVQLRTFQWTQANIRYIYSFVDENFSIIEALTKYGTIN